MVVATIYPLKAYFCYNLNIMEIWKDIVWYEWLYQVNNLWVVRSFHFQRWPGEKIMKPYKEKLWYLYINFSKRWKYKRYYIHRLVWQAFLWLDINNPKISVCHKDDNPWNNNKNNLFLWTHKQNLEDMATKWRSPHQWKFWHKHPRSKKVAQYSKKWEYIQSFWWTYEAWRKLWLNSYKHISEVCLWKRKTTWWFIFKYI